MEKKFDIIINFLLNADLDQEGVMSFLTQIGFCNEYRFNRIKYMKNKLFSIKDDDGSFFYWGMVFFKEYIKHQINLNRVDVEVLFKFCTIPPQCGREL